MKNLIDIALNKLYDYPSTSEYSGSIGDSSNAYYGFVISDTEVKTFEYPCHAYMRLGVGSKVIFSKYIRHTSFSSDESRQYLEWIMTGPWKRFFNCVYDETAEGFINYSLEHTPANLQQNFLIATRMIKEWPQFIKTWFTLVNKEHIHPSVAFWFITIFHNSSIGGALTPGNKIYMTDEVKYDWPIDVLKYDDKALYNFIHGDFSNLNHSYAKDPNYKPVNCIWGKQIAQTNKNSYGNLLRQRYNKLGKTEVVKSALLSPTAYIPRNLETWMMTYDEALEVIRQEEKRIFMS